MNLKEWQQERTNELRNRVLAHEVAMIEHKGKYEHHKDMFNLWTKQLQDWEKTVME